MYYTGTKEQCEEYNSLVVSGEKYDGIFTTDWANLIAHPSQDKFAILVHSNYTAELTLVDSLSSDWFLDD
jgi:hypothetical protein